MGRSRAGLLCLLTNCLAVAVVSAQDPPSRWRTGSQKPRTGAPAAAQAPEITVPTIKKLGVWTTVTGGRSSFGLVELNEPAPGSGVTIHLSSSDAAIVLPATIKVEAGAANASFPVQSIPVAAPTTVTVSARAGTAAAPTTATVTVVPPSVSFIGCNPQSVPAGTSTTCTVQLEGPVASSAEAATITLTSSRTAVASVPATAQIPAGERKTSFTVTTKPLAQSAASLISASYGGNAKGTNVHVLPVSLRAVLCSVDSYFSPTCSLPPQRVGRAIWGKVRLTAPAPAGGVTVTLADSPNYVNFSPGSLHIPAGQDTARFDILAVAVDTQTNVSITATASTTGDTRQAVLTIRPPQIKTFQIQRAEVSGVPIGGMAVPALIELNGIAPRGGKTYGLSYSGTTDITGPSQVTVPENGRQKGFQITVGPCSLAPCKVFISTGSWKDSLIVKP
jgi:hypothetical protein